MCSAASHHGHQLFRLVQIVPDLLRKYFEPVGAGDRPQVFSLPLTDIWKPEPSISRTARYHAALSWRVVLESDNKIMSSADAIALLLNC